MTSPNRRTIVKAAAALLAGMLAPVVARAQGRRTLTIPTPSHKPNPIPPQFSRPPGIDPALSYLSPEDLDASLFELGRLAKKVVILAEPVSKTEPTMLSRTAGGYQEWAHAYGKSLKWIGSMRGMTLRKLDINPPVDHLNAILVLERA